MSSDDGMANNGRAIGLALSLRVDVPYHEDREAWEAGFPTSCNNITEALDRLPYGITGLYFHQPTLNLVLLGPIGERVGIRSADLMSGKKQRLVTLKKADPS